VIVHEAARTCGFGAAIAAILSERAFPVLMAPVERVTGYGTVVRHAQAREGLLPDRRRIIEACERVMRYG
jgi:pyruvate dehydrogenase E1 component beta subunit